MQHTHTVKRSVRPVRATHEVKSFALALAIVTIDGSGDAWPLELNTYSNGHRGECRTGRGLKRGSGLARNQVRRRTFDLSTFVKCNLGGQWKWLQQLTEPLSHQAAGSINSTSNVLAALTVPSTSAPLSFSHLSPCLPLFFTLLQYLHRHRIRRFPHYIVLLLEFTKKLEKRPWKFFCLGLHSTRSGEQRLAPNLVVAANSNVRPALTLTLSF